MTKRHELTGRQWEKLKPLLPPEKPKTGRPSEDHCTLLNGMIWRAKSGAPWRDLPERYGKWKTVYSRWLRWRLAAGVGSVAASHVARQERRPELKQNRTQITFGPRSSK